MDNISTYHKYTTKEWENLVKYINKSFLMVLYIGANYLSIILLISLL